MTDTLWHIGGQILLPLTDPTSRTFLPFLLLAALGACVFHRLKHGRSSWKAALATHTWRHPSSLLDLQLLLARRLLAIVGVVPVIGGAWWLAIRVSTSLDQWFGLPEPPTLSTGIMTLAYTAVLFIVWDASRFILHLAMHKIPVLWQFHQVHHSAQVLTPLTFHRIHPVESVLYGLRGTLATGLMAGLAFWMFRGAATEYTIIGVHSVGFVLNALTGNLRHSHAWIRFPTSVERWLLSPAQHQVHHALDAKHHNANFGTWIACWDRLLGTLQTAPEQPISEVGLVESNHNPQLLISVLLAPVHSALRLSRPSRLASAAALLLALLPSLAHAQDDDEDDSDDGTMIVTAERGTTRVAGSAHVINEEELERHKYTDIHQVLASVPGVYLRGEDGFGLRPNIGLRGGNSDRSAKITLMEDGVLIAPAPYAAPAAYYFPMPIRMTGVEIIKGSAAIRHGPQTIGGAINLLTRRTPTDGLIAEIDTAYGSNNTLKTHGYSGYGTERWAVLGEVAHLSSDGFKEIDGGGDTGLQRQDAMLKGRFGSDQTEDIYTDFELKLAYGREVSNETYLGLTASDFYDNPNRRYTASFGDKMGWEHQQASLTWRLLVAQDFDLRTVFYHHRLDRQWFKVNGLSNGQSIHELLYLNPDSGSGEASLAMLRGEANSDDVNAWVLKGTNDRQFKNYGVQTVGHWRVDNDIMTNELEFGVRWHKDDVLRNHTQSPWQMTEGTLTQTDSELETTLDSHNDGSAIALHLHNHFTVGPLSVLPGIRHERIITRTGTRQSGPEDPQTHSIWLPGIGVYLKPSSWFSVLAGANKGFSPVAPGSAEGTLPETAWNYETGVQLSLQNSRAEVVGFYSDYENLTGQCTLSGGCTDDQLDTQFNGGEAVVKGVETTLGQVVALGLGIDIDMDATYAWTDGRFSTDFVSQFPQFGTVSTGDLLPYVPVHQGSAGLALIHTAATLSAKATGRSGMRDVAGSEDDPTAPAIESAITLDMGAEYRIGQHLALYGTGTNLTGQRSIESWRPLGARPNAPTRWMVGIKGSL